MSIIGSDEREIITSFEFPYSTVTAVDFIKDAYTDLLNYYIDTGVAENSNFAVVKFSRNATLYKNLTASEAITTIQGLTSSPAIEGTEYDNALYEGFNFLSQSPLNALNTTNIAYFVSDGRAERRTLSNLLCQ